MQIEKLKRLAVAVIDCEDVSGGISASMDFMAEISPVAVLELISEIERLRMERERVLADAAVGAAIQRAASRASLTRLPSAIRASCGNSKIFVFE